MDGVGVEGNEEVVGEAMGEIVFRSRDVIAGEGISELVDGMALEEGGEVGWGLGPELVVGGGGGGASEIELGGVGGGGGGRSDEEDGSGVGSGVGSGFVSEGVD